MIKYKLNNPNKFISIGAKLFPLSIYIYIILKQFYLFESGYPQISDIILIISIIFIFIYSLLNNNNIYISEQDIILILILIYIITINSLWFIKLNDTSFLISNIYYIFNFIAILYINISYDIVDYHLSLNLSYCAKIAIIILLFNIFANPIDQIRQIGGFNNPNQLGYYSVVLMTILYYNKENIKFIDLIFILLALWISILSLSKAAIVANVIMIMANINKKNIKSILILIFITFVVILIFSIGKSIDYKEALSQSKLVWRFANIFNETDSALIEGRGYGRIKEIGINIIWGFGEGGFNRYKIMTGMETHSTFITVLLSYGIIGFVLFILYFLYPLIIKKSSFRSYFKIFIGIILYMVSHNGIRNSLIWLMYAIYANDHYRGKTMPSATDSTTIETEYSVCT